MAPKKETTSMEAQEVEDTQGAKPLVTLAEEATGPDEDKQKMLAHLLKMHFMTLVPNKARWINLSVLAQKSEIRPEDYGYKKFSDLIRSFEDDFEIKVGRDNVMVRLHVVD